MASRVQKIKLWDTFKNAKSVILHFFPVAEIGRNIHLLYFSYPQEIYSQFVEWEKKVLSSCSPQWSVYFPVLLLLITRKHPVSSYLQVSLCKQGFWSLHILHNATCIHSTYQIYVVVGKPQRMRGIWTNEQWICTMEVFVYMKLIFCLISMLEPRTVIKW